MRTERVAVVTGAAGGIGVAVVDVLARHGGPILLLDTDETGLVATAEKLAANGAPVQWCTVDVTDRIAVEDAVADAERRWGPVTELAHVAGVLRPGSALDPDDDDREFHLAVNATGTRNVCRAVGARMPNTAGGRSSP